MQNNTMYWQFLNIKRGAPSYNRKYMKYLTYNYRYIFIKLFQQYHMYFRIIFIKFHAI